MHIPTLLLSFAVLSAFFVYQVDSRAAEPVGLPQVRDNNSSTGTAETRSSVSTETEADKGDAATNTIAETRTETQFEVRAVPENSTKLILSDENSADDEQPDGPVEENDKQLRFFGDDPSERILPGDFASEAFGFFRSVGGALLKIKLAVLSLNLIGLLYQSFRLISIVLTRLFPCLKSKVDASKCYPPQESAAEKERRQGFAFDDSRLDFAGEMSDIPLGYVFQSQQQKIMKWR